MMQVLAILVLACGLAGCSREPVKRSSEPASARATPPAAALGDARDPDASATEQPVQGMVDATDAPGHVAEIDDMTVCRLRRGCDGGADCPEFRPCVSCFEAAAADKDPGAREACRELYLRNGCQDRCVGLSQAAYDTCEGKCRTVYRDPSAWPPAK